VHRRKRSSERSAAYYRTEDGRRRKKLLNCRRSQRGGQGSEGDPEREAAEGEDFSRSVVAYVRLVTSLIEGRAVGVGEVLEMLRRTLRQHRIGRRRRIDYILWHLKRSPP
jgi:hypothetical protein